MCIVAHSGDLLVVKHLFPRSTIYTYSDDAELEDKLAMCHKIYINVYVFPRGVRRAVRG